MAREIEGLRDAVVEIRKNCPDKEIFGVDDVSKLLKKSKHFVKDNLMPDTRNLYITELARRLCKMSQGKEVV